MSTKMKKQKKKIRQDIIAGTAKDKVSSLTVSYNPKDGTIQIDDIDPETLNLNRSYERVSGKEKLLTSIKTKGTSVSFDTWPELRSSFDYLVAVDTNTRTIADRRLSVSIAYHSPRRLKEMTKEVPFVPLCGYVMLDVSPEVNPERMGWHLILKNHTDARFFMGLHLGFIVDSELGAIPAINKRAMPYYRSHLLPSYSTMIYASDAASDSLPNQMIRYCDKAANSVFQYFDGDLSTISHITSDDDNCKGYAWFETKMA